MKAPLLYSGIFVKFLSFVADTHLLFELPIKLSDPNIELASRTTLSSIQHVLVRSFVIMDFRSGKLVTRPEAYSKDLSGVTPCQFTEFGIRDQSFVVGCSKECAFH